MYFCLCHVSCYILIRAASFQGDITGSFTARCNDALSASYAMMAAFIAIISSMLGTSQYLTLKQRCLAATITAAINGADIFSVNTWVLKVL